MAGLVPAIHVLLQRENKDVDARHKAGHDEAKGFSAFRRVVKRAVGAWLLATLAKAKRLSPLVPGAAQHGVMRC
jgi:hypothetical protein